MLYNHLVLNWLQKYFSYLLLALIFFTAFLPAAGLLPDRQLLLIILTVALLALFLTFNLPIKLTPAHLSFAFFLLFSLITTFFSVWPVNSFLTLILIAAYFTLFLLASNSSFNLRKLTLAVVFGGTTISIWAVAKYAFVNQMSIERLLTLGRQEEAVQLMTMANKVFANFARANSLAGFLALIIPLLIGLLLAEEKEVLKFWLALALLVNLVAFFLTFSRGGFLSLSFALMLMAFFSVWQRQQLKSQKLAPKLLIIAILLGFIFLTYNFGFFSHFRLASILTSTVSRLELWQAALKMIARRPFFGFGLGSFGTALPPFQISSVYSLYAHNSYLQLAAEGGVITLVLLVFTFALFLREGYQKLVVSGRQEKQLRVGLLASLTTFILHNIVDFTWYVPGVALLFWFLAGLAVSSPTTQAEGDLVIKANNTALSWQRQLAFVLLIFAVLPLAFAYIGTSFQVQAELKLRGFSYREAARLAKLAVKFFPYNAEAYDTLAKAYVQPIKPQKQIQQAIAAERKAIKLRPTWPHYYTRLAEYLALTGASSKQVWANYQKAIKLYPLEPQLKLKAGNQLLKLGEYQKAINAYQQTVKLSQIYQADKQTAKSFKTARVDVAIPGRTIGLAYLGLAKSYAYLGQVKKAQISLKKAEKILSKVPGVIFTQGLIKEKQGNLSQAVKFYQQAADKTPFILGEINYRLALVYLKLGQKTKALAELKKAANTEPKFQPAIKLYKKLRLKEANAVK